MVPLVKATDSVSIERAKVYALIYAILIIFNGILFFSTGYLITATADMRMRAFTLMWIGTLIIALVVVEMFRSLYDSGGNPLALSLLGILNVIFVGMQLAVYADIMVYDVADTPIALLILYLIIASVGILIMCTWMIWKYAKSRKVVSPVD